MMKILIKLFFCIIILSLLAVLITDKMYLLTALRVTYLKGNTDVTIYDYKVQETNVIEAKNKQPWKLHQKYNQVKLSDNILKHHKNLESIAFIVVKDGQILTEEYFNEGSKEHLSGVWSITKTYTAMLILKAIEDGLIDDIDDPVTKYIPELEFEQRQILTLRHLASMSAGLYWKESAHSPFSLITKFNFYNNLEKLVLNDMSAVREPGEVQHYNSGGIQILGLVLERVLGGKSISDYLSEKIWNPMGYEFDGGYILDSKKYANEKAFCGLVMTARDVSRLGQLINQKGKWNGQQILSVKDINLIQTLPYNNTSYNYGVWSGVYKGYKFYFQAGYLGQYCISVPDLNLVITRLGHKASPKKNALEVNPDTYIYIEEAIRILQESGIDLLEQY